MKPERQLYFNLIAPVYALVRVPSAAELEVVDRLLGAAEWEQQDHAEVLDLGAGAGHQARALLRRYRNLRVTEAEPALLFRAMSRFWLAREKPAVRRRSVRVAAMAEGLPFPNDAFDAAVCLFVLWSVEDRGRVLAELRRVLKPGAPLVLGEFAAPEETPGGEALGAMWLPFGHPPLSSEVELRALVEPYFRVTEVVRRSRALYCRCLSLT